MSACIALRDDYDSLALRDLARRSRAPRQVRRLLALAAAYDGVSRTEAAKVGGMDRQTLRDWAHRFNDEGPDGLKHRSGAGRPRLLTQEQMSELSAIVETGPDPEVDGVVRWRRPLATYHSSNRISIRSISAWASSGSTSSIRLMSFSICAPMFPMLRTWSMATVVSWLTPSGPLPSST